MSKILIDRDVVEQAQVEQEPYAWMSVGGTIWRHKTCADDVPLYTHPQPPRQPLTEEQIDSLAMDEDGLPNSHIEFARAIERAYGIGEPQ